MGLRLFRTKSDIVFGILLISIVLIVGCDQQPDYGFNRANNALTGIDTLQADSTGGFARAFRSRVFEFPQDHLGHPEFKHEWWYFTGNLSTPNGDRLGYQLTLFRIGLKPDEKIIKTKDYVSGVPEQDSETVSKWRTNHIYMGHLALTDITNQRFYHYEKFSRGVMGLAGSELVKAGMQLPDGEEASAIKIWLEDWQIISHGQTTFPLSVKAQKGDVALELTLDPLKSVVYHGYEGLSQKGRKQGNASYYYSITRLDSKGKISIKDQTFNVTGTSWFDREWSTSTLEKQQVGWDWFALQLEDGRDIMFYKMRREDNSMDRYSNGTIVYKNGKTTSLNFEDVDLEETDYWQSPHSKVEYPAAWKIRIPKENLELTVEPFMADQENNLTVRYWEGAVKVQGIQHNDRNKEQVSGYGYVELAGYK
ncbi:lipocalin-like domain-containing protein [Kaarinaea lacus]